ncbi:MAG: hypothetical protein KDA61_22690 [Planctomycetales bacterium]|nr:hypothetical protein [Planctomycetales bacterium]
MFQTFRRLVVSNASWAAVLGVISMCGMDFPLVVAQEFRVETEVFVGDAAEPTGRATTLYEKSAVYHFVDSPAEIVVYRRGVNGSAGQFILLDLARQVRTEIPLDRMEKLVEKLTEWSAGQDAELPKFAARPEFKQSIDDKTGTLTLANDLWTYRVATVAAEEPACLLRFREFTDAYARLNCVVHHGLPPGPRLALNSVLAERGLAPIEIQREVSGQKESARSVQFFSWRLSREDRDRLDDAREKIASFKKVSNEAFQQKAAE